MITDWNDIYAAPFRKSVNFYVPCYLLAFPPFEDIRSLNEKDFHCPLAGSLSSAAVQREQGFYRDLNIVQCDTYLGVIMLNIGAIFFTFLIVSYGWIFFSFISLGVHEFRKSRWVTPLIAVQEIYDAEVHLFQVCLLSPLFFLALKILSFFMF